MKKTANRIMSALLATAMILSAACAFCVYAATDGRAGGVPSGKKLASEILKIDYSSESVYNDCSWSGGTVSYCTTDGYLAAGCVKLDAADGYAAKYRWAYMYGGKQYYLAFYAKGSAGKPLTVDLEDNGGVENLDYTFKTNGWELVSFVIEPNSDPTNPNGYPLRVFTTEKGNVFWFDDIMLYELEDDNTPDTSGMPDKPCGDYGVFNTTKTEFYAAVNHWVSLEQGKTYTVSFDAASNISGESVWFDIEGQPLHSETFTKQNEWEHFEFTYTVPASARSVARVYRNYAVDAITYVDDLVIKDQSGNVILDFSFDDDDGNAGDLWWFGNTNGAVNYRVAPNHTGGNWTKDANGHYRICTVCGSKLSYAKHEYSSDCDGDCNVCGYERSSSGHTFIGEWFAFADGHYRKCSECGADEAVSAHEYSSDCDTNCDICGYARTALSHSFGGNWYASAEGHFQKCTECGIGGEVSAHVYTDKNDGDCNVCGFVRALPNTRESALPSGYEFDPATFTEHFDTVSSYNSPHWHPESDYAKVTYCTDTGYTSDGCIKIVVSSTGDSTYGAWYTWTGNAILPNTKYIATFYAKAYPGAVLKADIELAMDTVFYTFESSDWEMVSVPIYTEKEMSANGYAFRFFVHNTSSYGTFYVDDLVIAPIVKKKLPPEQQIKTGMAGDDVKWTYDASTQTLLLEGSGAMSNFNENSTPWNEYKQDISTVLISDNITVIGNNSFGGCTGLRTVYLPKSVKTVSAAAFSGCTKVKDVYYGGNTSEYGSVKISAGNDPLKAAETTVLSNMPALGESEKADPDVNKDGDVTEDDAIYVLYYTFFPDVYPITSDCDFDSNGSVDADDAIYLLFHVLFPTDYPLPDEFVLNLNGAFSKMVLGLSDSGSALEIKSLENGTESFISETVTLAPPANVGSFDVDDWKISYILTGGSSGEHFCNAAFGSRKYSVEYVFRIVSDDGSGPYQISAELFNNSGRSLDYSTGNFFALHTSLPDSTAWKFSKESGTAEGFYGFGGTGIYKTAMTNGAVQDAWCNLYQNWNASGFMPIIYLDNGSRGLYTALEWTNGRVIATGKSNGVDIAVNMDGTNYPGKAFNTNVDDGDVFVVPTVYLGMYEGSIDDGSNFFKNWFLQRKAPANLRDDPNEPLAQMDMQLGYDVSKYGIQQIKWDYGWWSDKKSNQSASWMRYEGSWVLRNSAYIGVVAPYGGTIAGFAKKAGDSGVKLAVYILLHDTVDENMNPVDTQGEFNSKTHPSWFSDRRIDSGMGCSADLGNEECVAYIQKTLLDFMKSNNITTWRSDFEPICYWSNKQNRHYANGSDVQYWCTVGFGEIQEYMQKNYPGYRYESCCSGGGMKDFYTAQYASNFNIDDSGKYLSLRASYYDASYCFHPVQIQLPGDMECFCTESSKCNPVYGNEYKDSVMKMGFRTYMLAAFNVCCSSGPNASGLPYGVQSYMQTYFNMYNTKLKPLIRNGNLYHILPRPDGTNWDGVMYTDADAAQYCGVMYIFKPSASVSSTKRVYAKGLDPNTRYVVEFEDHPENNTTKLGSELMNNGIDVLINGVGSEMVWFKRA